MAGMSKKRTAESPGCAIGSPDSLLFLSYQKV
jgi:hypothetical protein